jgi:foldase protein PrsA
MNAPIQRIHLRRVRQRRCRRCALFAVFPFTIVAAMGTGCAARNAPPLPVVREAWFRQNAANPGAEASPVPSSLAPLSMNADFRADTEDDVLAIVEGRPISRRRVSELLWRSFGPGILEQLIGLEAAAHRAERKGLSVSEADVQREYDLALRKFANPWATNSTTPIDPVDTERLLDTVLAERRVSREEFMIGVRRNAYLRKLVETDLKLSEEQLDEEFRRAFGRRVEVRHIQLATLGEVSRVRDRLAAGEEFASLAERYSANTATAQNGGLLDPFTADDDSIPAVIRQTAFALEPGAVSSAIRVGEWYHLIRCGRILPAQEVALETVRPELERRLRDRLVPPAMEVLYQELIQGVRVQIQDPLLRGLKTYGCSP